jgi:hypothetical protein
LARGLRQTGRWIAPALAVAATAWLAGCAGMSQQLATTASQMPGIGLPADAPPRPVAQGEYPAVHDMPAPRNSVMLTEIEQQKLEDDLASARDRQQRSVGLPPAEPKKTKAAPRRPVVPVSSGRSIY